MAAVKPEEVTVGKALAAKLYHTSDHDSVQELTNLIQTAVSDKRRPGQDVLVALVATLAACIESSPYPKDDMILAVFDLLINSKIRMKPDQLQ